MKVATTGSKGNVGQALIRKGCIPLDCDVRDLNDIRRAIKKVAPDVIVNPASKSLPNWCEDKDNTKEAYEVNVFGLHKLWVATDGKIPIVTLSTDQIFPGKNMFKAGIGFRKSGPYKEDDKAYPVNYYGVTKLAMEMVADALSDNVKVVRTSNLFHENDPRVKWYIDAAYEKPSVPVPAFQTRSFMHIDHFANALMFYIEHLDTMPKILHISGSKTVSWYKFILAVADEMEFPFKYKFTKKLTNDKSFVPRPYRAGLDTSLSAGLGIPQHDYLQGMILL